MYFLTQGLHFTIHVDAAFEGYFAFILKDDLKLRHGYPLSEENENESAFSEYIIQQHKTLKYVDTVAIDPHKTGFVPCPAGVRCYRNGLNLTAPTVDNQHEELLLSNTGTTSPISANL